MTNMKFSEEEYEEIETKVKELNEYRNYYGEQKFSCDFARQADGEGWLRYYDTLEGTVKDEKSVVAIKEAIDKMYRYYVFTKEMDEVRAEKEADSIEIPISIMEKLEWQTSGSCMDDTEYGRHYYNDYITCKRFTREEFKVLVQELADALKENFGEADDIDIKKEEGCYDRYIYMFKNQTFRLTAIYDIDGDEPDSVEFAYWK